jgi:tRNA1(Val) A37 N6-methylase TrmN6
VSELTSNGFLGGRITVRQSQDGFRSGLDAVMLAAAVPAGLEDTVLELGCGVGVASLCLAVRCADTTITGLDIFPQLVSLAQSNAVSNGLDARARFVTGDVFDLPPELRSEFDHVLTNPPFHKPSGNRSPKSERADALTDAGRLDEWLAAGLKRTRSSGTFTVIFRADRLAEVLEALPGAGCTVFPLWPRRGEPAKRVMVQIRKGSHEPLTLLPGLVLHEADGRYTPDAEAVLRNAGSLALGSPRL